jgi:hypothetical protein
LTAILAVGIVVNVNTPPLSESEIQAATALVLRRYDDLHYPQCVSPKDLFVPGAHRDALVRDVQHRLATGDFARSATTFRIPKTPTTTRIITIPDLVDQVIYQALVSWLHARAHELLHPDTHSLQEKPCSVLEWIGFREAQIRLCGQYSWVACWDLADYFETIPHQLLGERVLTEFLGVGAEELSLRSVRDTLRRLLSAWHQDDRGIPQGPPASFFLADVLLLDSDRALRGQGFKVLRWCDDRSFFTDSQRHALDACRAAECRDRAMGLVRSSAKADVRTSTEHENALREEEPVRTRVLQTQEAGRLNVILDLLSDGHVNTMVHAKRFLLKRAYEIVYHRDVTAQNLTRIAEVATQDLDRDPAGVRRWWLILSRLATAPAIQEATDHLIRADVMVDETSVAYLQDVFLHCPDAKLALPMSRRHALLTAAADPSAGPSRRGKALLLAARGKLGDWRDAVPVNEAHERELRSYQAVAIQAFEPKQRRDYARELNRHCASSTERAYSEFFQYHQAGLWTSPLPEPREPSGYW